MIIDLLALLMILSACGAAGILFTAGRREHERAERRASEQRLAEEQELYAAWEKIHVHTHGGREPSGVDPLDRLPI
jgi:hypothetical protein